METRVRRWENSDLKLKCVQKPEQISANTPFRRVNRAGQVQKNGLEMAGEGDLDVWTGQVRRLIRAASSSKNALEMVEETDFDRRTGRRTTEIP